ncbi:universal stress protein [Macrococcus equi]|uniref:universal stress protein n=1 Tax=Macrococcus equi TaxID=3395462 RepID=UPI0039BE07DA
MYQSVVVAVDGSKNSYRAAEEALKLNASKYTLLSVVSHEDSKDAILHSEQSSSDKRKALLEPIIDLYENKANEFNVMIEHGIPKDVIIQNVKRHNYNVLVIGSRGLNPLQEMVMGSVSRKVIKEIAIPILVVK